MIPIEITLKGIYSYQEPQTINFNTLSKNHLFGIFGPVGSGKSTILEAMTFALYGESERLNNKDSRNYNMMNLKSDELLIDFTFAAGTDHKDIYRFTVRAKRNKKRFEDVGTYERNAYKKEGTEWTPIEPEKAEGIVGLSYDNFRRTIIIPQGKFAEFLQLEDSKRSEMMKEIFALERFDLFDKAGVLEMKNNEKLEGVKGQLQQIGDVTKEKIDSDSGHLVRLQTDRKKLNEKLKEQDKNEKALEDLRKLQEKITEQATTVKNLAERESEFLKKEKQVEEFETCEREFRDILAGYEAQERKLAELNHKIIENKKRATKLNSDVEQKSKLFDVVKTKYDNRADLKTQWEEHESLLHVLQLDKDIESYSEREHDLLDDDKKLKDKLSEIKSGLDKCNQSIKELKNSLPDETNLVEMSKWFTRRQGLVDQIKDYDRAIKEARGQLKTLGEQKDVIAISDGVSRLIKASERSLPVDKLVERLKDIKKSFREEIRVAERNISTLHGTAVLEEFAKELAEGEPCPLCGSETHPKVYHAKGVKSKITELEKEKQNLEDKIEVIDQSLSDLGKLGGSIEAAEFEFTKAEKNKKSKESALAQHDDTFKWRGYSIDDQKKVDKELDSLTKLKKKIEENDNAKSELEEDREETNENLKSIQEKIQEIKQHLAAKKSERKVTLDKAKHVDAEAILGLSTKEIKAKIESLRRQYTEIEQQYATLEQQQDTLNKELNQLSGEIASEEKLSKESEKEIKNTRQEMDRRLNHHGYNDIVQVKTILLSGIDVKAERKAIQKFREELQSAKEHLEKLKGELGNRSYDKSKHDRIKELVSKLRDQLEDTDKEIGKLQSVIEENIKKLKRKADLEAEKLKLENKASNLKVLRSLFKGKGFVNYVSRVYLTNLCAAANDRFAQLTKQRLRLELTDSNSFQVRDYLNDGRSRNVKTLSGGQTFQASLSLALALADNIQHFAQSSQSFFFLDEGFGSLDKEALQIVFDALKSLRHENRIVGVISHVEEMKQEIENYVSVELQEGHGSVVSVN